MLVSGMQPNNETVFSNFLLYEVLETQMSVLIGNRNSGYVPPLPALMITGNVFVFLC